jgi:hypothetical protein
MTSGWRCPLIFGPNGDPYAGESNGFDAATGKWFRVCVKNPWREPVPQSQAQTFTNPVATQTETKTVATQTETKTVATQTETKTVATQTETKTATTPAPIAVSQGCGQAPLRACAPGEAPGPSSGGSVAPNFVCWNGLVVFQAIDCPLLPSVATTPKVVTTAIDSDGIEADSEANLTAKKDSAGRTTFTVSSNLAEETVIITATKKGSKSIKYSIKTDESGQAKLRTTRNLSGFTLTLKFENEILDTVKIK